MTAPDAPLVARAPKPGSVLHRHFGDARAGLFGPHALLLQVMHPVIDAGVRQHSRFKKEPFSRFYETARSMATIVYGGDEGSAAECRRLRKMHVAIRGVDDDGRRYHALDPEAWAWVYATLVKGSMDSQFTFGPGVNRATLETYYREARELGLSLGVRVQDLPESWTDFESYFDTMIAERLVATESARDVLAFLGELPKPFFVPRFVWRPLTWPVAWTIRFVTTGTLPAALRERLGLSWSTSEERWLERLKTLATLVSFVTPQTLLVAGTRVVGFLNARRVLRLEARTNGT